MQRVHDSMVVNNSAHFNKQVFEDILSKSQVHQGYKGILDIMKEREAVSKKVEQMYQRVRAADDASDDEVEGRSIHQEIDYSNKRLASKTIQQANMQNGKKVAKIRDLRLVTDGSSQASGPMSMKSNRSVSTNIKSLK